MAKGNLSGSELGFLVLRLALGAIFVAHGVTKLLPENGGLEGFTGVIGSLNLPLPSFPVALAVVIAEIGGGILVAVGVLPRIAALALAGVMAGAIATVHLDNGFFLLASAAEKAIANWPTATEGVKVIPHGIEYNVALLAMSLHIVLAGGGKLVLWAPRKKDKKKK
jgi:putative oxidoreductase